MKATGIVRRIDDLGRVVIPKEIRRTMRLREGDPLEIFIDGEGSVVFKKYSMLDDLTQFDTLLSSLDKILGRTIILSDRDKVTWSNSGRFRESRIDENFNVESASYIENLKFYGDTQLNFSGQCCPITIHGDLIGWLFVEVDKDAKNFLQKVNSTAAVVVTAISLALSE